MPPGQQGEGQGLPLLVADSQAFQGPHPHPSAAQAELFHQQAVAGSTTGHEQLERTGAAALEVLGHDCSGEGGERGQGVGGALLVLARGQARQAPFQIGRAEPFPAGGFRGPQLEVVLLQPIGDPCFVDQALAGPGAIGIKAQAIAAETSHGQIEQGVRRSAVPALHGRVPFWPTGRGEQGEIGDASQVEQGLPAADAAKQRSIGSRYQGSALAPQGEVGAAEVEHHRPSQPFRQHRGLQNLPAAAVSPRLRRPVPERLAMAAHQGGLSVWVTALSRQGLLLGDGLPQFQEGGGRERFPLADRHQAVLQLRRIGSGVAGENAPAGSRGRTAEFRQHRIHPVSAGAAHQSQNLHRPLAAGEAHQWVGRDSSALELPITTSSSFSRSTWEAGGLTFS